MEVPIGLKKSREEQDKDFEIIKQWANPLCHLCFGRGHRGWSVELLQYIPCGCVSERILQEKEKDSPKIITVPKGIYVN